MAKEPDQQIFFGNDLPLHDLFQQQVRGGAGQVRSRRRRQAGDPGGDELPVLRRRRHELHREDQPEKEVELGSRPLNRKRSPVRLFDRDRLDLDLEAVVQLRHRHHAARRPRAARPFRIERVERRPDANVGDIDADLRRACRSSCLLLSTQARHCRAPAAPAARTARR